MKICFFLNLPLCEKLIHDIVTVRFAHELSKKNMDIRLYYSGKKIDSEICRYYGINALPNLQFIPNIRLKIVHPIKISSSLVTKTHMAFQLIQAIKNKNCDMVIVNEKSLLFLKIIADFFNIPFVFEAHAPIQTIYNLQNVIVTTESLKNKIEKELDKTARIKVLHLSPNNDSFCDRPYKNQNELKNLFYAGQLLEDRGILTIIDAMKKLPEDYKLTLYGGRGKTLNTIQRIIDENNLSHRIETKGFVSPSKLETLLCERKGIFIVPPLAKKNYDVIAHTKLIDALGRGNIIVASELPSIYETAKEIAFFFKPGDSDSLAETIRSISLRPLHELNNRLKKTKLLHHDYSYESRAKRFIEWVKEWY